MTDRPLAIVLIGVSGSGKSTVGRMLAPALGATFLEGDDFHPAANVAKMRAGTPLTDEDRWPWLAALGRAIGRQTGSTVTACSALRRVYREALATAAAIPLTFVHLKIDPASIDARLRARPGHFMPASLLESQLATLEPLGPDEPGTEILETGSVETTVAAIADWTARHRALHAR